MEGYQQTAEQTVGILMGRKGRQVENDIKHDARSDRPKNVKLEA